MKRILLMLLIITFIFSACGYSQEDLDKARNDGYAQGYDEGYEKGHLAGYREGYAALKPVDKPASGYILYGNEYSESEITITASEAPCVVSLKSSAEKTLLSFFVRSGDTVTVGVPARDLYVYFASGINWYGYGKGLMFGKDTAYSRDDELLDFANYTWEYTLYPVTNGNFSQTPCNEADFF